MKPRSIDSESLCDHFWVFDAILTQRGLLSPVDWTAPSDDVGRVWRGIKEVNWGHSTTAAWTRSPVGYHVTHDVGAKWDKFRSVTLFGRKISCRISWRHCFLDLRNIYWDIWQKSSNLPNFGRKKCIPVEQLFKADSPHLAGTITIEKAAREYPIRPGTPIRSRDIVDFVWNF